MKLKNWNEYDNTPAKTRWVKNLVESSEKRIQLVLESKIRRAKKEMVKTFEDLEKRLRRMVREQHEDQSRISVEKSGEKKIIYLCDGNNECSGHGECYKIGGSCRHTYDINHAKNFHQYKGLGPWMENVPDQSSDVKEIRCKIVPEGVRGKIAGDSLRHMLESLRSSASTSTGPIEITVIGGRTRLTRDYEYAGDQLEKVLEDVRKIREKYPDAKINVEFTE